jgi:hypothetical protein
VWPVGSAGRRFSDCTSRRPAVFGVFNASLDPQCPAERIPGAVDPFYGPNSACGRWFEAVWAFIDGAQFVDLHGYIRGPNPELCWSDDQIGSPPLRWQYLNYWGCCQTILVQLPVGDEYDGLSVLLSEFNHLWKDVEPNCGWVTDVRAGDVIRAAHEQVQEWNASKTYNPVRWLCVYRWQGDDWAVKDNAEVKKAILSLS